MRKSDFIFEYRDRNCPEYNRALVRHGTITLWVEEQAAGSRCQHKVAGARNSPPELVS